MTTSRRIFNDTHTHLQGFSKQRKTHRVYHTKRYGGMEYVTVGREKGESIVDIQYLNRLCL